MNERNALETDIAAALESQHLGTWAASDLGPGGMNVLYDTANPMATLPIVVRVLEARGVQNRTRIALRLMTKADDWRYEVVYPVDFSGSFNSL
ncbi:MAG: hypothetical protein JWR44_46 [Hymenobacter sp.]|jgi:hypothetical protein|nr:hypothetical protein [Hymenobacter sp.]